MKRMDLYLGRTVLSATLLAWLVVVSLETIFSLLGELGDIGRGQYELTNAVGYLLLTLPGRACRLFPMAVLLGSLLGLGSLAAQWEITALRLVGCSPARLARSVLQAGALMLVLVVAVAEGLAPSLQQEARQLRASAIFDEVQVQGHGFWVREGDRLIQVTGSEVDGRLSGLAIFEIGDAARLVSATSVQHAWFEEGVWHLQDLRESRFGEDGVELRSTASLELPHFMDPGLADLLARDPQALTLGQLRRYIAYQEKNGADVRHYRLVYWQRLAAPVVALAMLLLSLGLVMGPLGRRGAGKRILVGVLAGLGFKLLNDIVAHAGLVYGLAPPLGAFLPALIVFVAGTWLLRRERRGSAV